MFVQTIYESRITGDFGPLALLSLQKKAVTRNRDLGITSFLYHDTERILHVVEGRQDMLNETMGRIEASNRHTDIKIRSILRCETRSFPHWYFGTTTAQDPYFQRVFRALRKPAFFKLDVLEAMQILQMVASKKRRAVKMNKYRIKLHDFNENKKSQKLFATL